MEGFFECSVLEEHTFTPMNSCGPKVYNSTEVLVGSEQVEEGSTEIFSVASLCSSCTTDTLPETTS